MSAEKEMFGVVIIRLLPARRHQHPPKELFGAGRWIQPHFIFQAASELAEKRHRFRRGPLAAIQIYQLKDVILVKGVRQKEHFQRFLQFFIIFDIVTGGNSAFKALNELIFHSRARKHQPLAKLRTLGNVKIFKKIIADICGNGHMRIFNCLDSAKVSLSVLKIYRSAVGDNHILRKRPSQKVEGVAEVIVRR